MTLNHYGDRMPDTPEHPGKLTGGSIVVLLVIGALFLGRKQHHPWGTDWQSLVGSGLLVFGGVCGLTVTVVATLGRY